MTVTLEPLAHRGLTAAHAHALVLLADGATGKDTAREVGITLGRLVQLARREGWHIHPTTGKAVCSADPDQPLEVAPWVRELAATYTPEPTPEQKAGSLDRLLAEAADYPDDRKIQHAVKQLNGTADRLRELVGTATERAEAAKKLAAKRAEAANKVAELERQLAAARAHARELKAPVGRSGISKEESAKIRAWAKANDHQVAERGRIPETIIDAYNSAHA